MRFSTLASGSSGNSTYIGSDSTHLLVDCGISCRRIETALREIDLGLSDLNGILITHEHSDHINGLAVLAGKTQAPIYGTRETLKVIRRSKAGKGIDPERFIPVAPDEPIPVGDLTVDPLHISHDAADPVGYRIFGDGRKAVVCTDLGCYDDYTVEALRDSDVLLLEANHDVNMLQCGHYPYALKTRILGDKGHLCNVHSGQLLTKVLNDHMKCIALGHLSKENNYPDLAFETVRVEIMMDGRYHPNDLPLFVSPRDQRSPVTEF